MDYNFISTLIISNSKLIPAPESYKAPKKQIAQYIKTIGFLIYIIFGIQLDITFAISIFNYFSANPTNKYLQIAKTIFCYFKKTINFKFEFSGFLEKLIGFINANWAINIATK